MDRRTFLAASAAAGLGPLAGFGELEAQQQGDREIYEIRRYHMIAGTKTQAMNTFFTEVAFPR